MLLPVLPSESIHQIVLPDLFIQDAEIIGGIIDRGLTLLYKLEHEGKRIIVSATSYQGERVALLPREIISLLNLDEQNPVVKCARFIERLPSLTGIAIKPLNTDFYRSSDIRSLVERKLVNVPVVHRGVQLELKEGQLLPQIEIDQLHTLEAGNQVTSAVVKGDQDIILDFAPNDPLYELYLSEETERAECERKEKLKRQGSREERFERIKEMRRQGRLVFGVSAEYYEYVKNTKSVHGEIFKGASKTIL
jgi:hypothetical protein